MYITRLITSLLITLALTGCMATMGQSRDRAAAPAAAPEDTSAGAVGKATSANDKAYVIGPDDQIQVNVWRNPELSVSVPVRPDGKITMPLIGDVQAGGRTPQQVAAAVEKDLDEYLKSPRVAVIVTELRSHAYANRVRVTGAVENPVSMPYRSGMTVLDAVLEAGGLTDFAAANRARLYRRAKGEATVQAVRLGDILARGELDTNIALMPGDVITVPERLF